MAPIEAKFYAQLLEKLEIDPSTLPDQNDMRGWPEIRERFAAVFRTRTRDEWDAILEGTDCCYAPVLSFAEAQQHPHNIARGNFVPVEGSIPQVRPAPRLSRTPGEVRPTYAYPGCDTRSVLTEFGIEESQIDALATNGTIAW